MSGVHTRCPDEFNDWVPWELIFHPDRFFCILDTSHQIDTLRLLLQDLPQLRSFPVRSLCQ
jgi:hypothetical protein